MAPLAPQRIRDPLHNLIPFAPTAFEAMLFTLVQTPIFQRLRGIRQLDFSELVYPGATHTRFAHSLGVMHLARRLVKVIEERIDWADPERAEVAITAALLHDIGHGPFSHAFEHIGEQLHLPIAHHERVTERLMLESEITTILNAHRPKMAQEVANIINGTNPDIYTAVVSSQFDADRLDYMQRDRLMTGVGLGQTDFEWLLQNLEVGTTALPGTTTPVPTLVLNPKGIMAAESYVLGLFQLYPTVYMHRTSRGAARLFSQLMLHVFQLSQQGDVAHTGLEKTHPLVAFAQNPQELNNFLNLDDAVVLGALPQLANAPHKGIAELATRLRYRKLYQPIDIRLQVERALHAQAPELIDDICAQLHTELKSLALPNLLLDSYTRTPYHQPGAPGSEKYASQIMVRTPAGTLENLHQHSAVVRAIRPFNMLRAYLPPEDETAQKAVHAHITQAINRTKNGELFPA